MDQKTLERVVDEVVRRLQSDGAADGVLQRAPERIAFAESDRLDTGIPGQRVYTRDLFSLAESPRLGAGLMEMTDAEFPWTLQYDEVDYVISGRLEIITPRGRQSAGPGEVLLIPKGSAIRFRAEGTARFLYVTYPADWQGA